MAKWVGNVTRTEGTHAHLQDSSAPKDRLLQQYWCNEILWDRCHKQPHGSCTSWQDREMMFIKTVRDEI